MANATTEELVLIKLGGSLITDKRGSASPRRDVIARLAAEIAEFRASSQLKVAIGHGSGSFGHVAAARHGLGKQPYRGTPAGLAETQDQAARLHRIVVEELLGAGLTPFSWSASTALTMAKGRLRGPKPLALINALDLGLLPVFFGDVQTAAARDQVGIASTEAICTWLIPRLESYKVRRILWLGETPGIYDQRGDTVAQIKGNNLRSVARAILGPAGHDVTGGMDLRLRTAWHLGARGVESLIADGRTPGLLRDALEGHMVTGTRISPR